MGRAAGVNASEGRLSSSRASPRFSLSRGWPMMAREEIGGHPEPFFLRVGGVRDFNRGHPPRESARCCTLLWMGLAAAYELRTHRWTSDRSQRRSSIF
jgi:hypothetical protein